MVHHLRTWALCVVIGLASWYSYIGRTANGERFNGTGYTAASMTLPFGALVKVERVHDGRFVIVRINDRGPHIKGRVIDLTKQAFRHIGKTGEGVVKVKVIVISEGYRNR